MKVNLAILQSHAHGRDARATHALGAAVHLGCVLMLAMTLSGCISLLPDLAADSGVDQTRLERALEHNPQNIHAQFLRGRALLAENDPAGAASHFARAIELDSNFQEAYLGLGLARLEQKKYRAAIEAYESLLRVNSKSAAAHQGLAAVHLVSGEVAKAEEQARRALELDPQSAQAHRLLGEVAYIRADYGAALRHWREAVAIDPALGQTLDRIIIDLEKYTNTAPLRGQTATTE